MRLQLFAIAIVGVMLAAACGGSGDDAESEALRAQIAALQAQADRAEDRSEVVARPTRTPVRTATPTATPSGPGCSIAASSQTVIASTVKVVTGSGTGTAFYMGGSEFITAAHVVEGYASVRLEAAGLSVVAQVVGLSSSADVAILRASTSLKPLKWGDSSTLGAGQSITVAGYPPGVETSVAAVASGLVSRVFIDSGQRVIQTDAAINPGNSGGAAFDECGRVVGMVTSKIVRTAVEGVGFVVAESSVRSALPEVRAHPLIECSTRNLNVPAGKSVRWGFEALPVGYTVSGTFSVEPRTSGELLDVRARLVDRLDQSIGDEIQVSESVFTLLGSPAGARAIVFDNSYSVFTSKNITIKWCEFG